MFKIFKFVFFLLIAGIAAAFLHYNLPDRDIVRVVGTFEIRDDKPAGSFGAGLPDAGSQKFPNRDVRYISTKRPNGKAMVYSNQDTGWGWPPYFKFDTSNLTADAQDLILRYEANEEIWVAVRHYGWRIEIFSLYPNAVSIKEVDGPNARLIPVFNIVFLTLLFSLILFIWWKIRQWKTKNVDPITDKIGDELEDLGQDIKTRADAAGDTLTQKGNAIGHTWRKLFGTTKPQ
jgi:frataxin-like iron-binding protein CyaY